MALYGVVSVGGSPGATTTALALALSWPREVILAECDLAGGSVLAGFLVNRLYWPPGPGLLGLAMEVARDPRHVVARIEDYTIPLTDHGQAKLLPGIRDPRHAPQLAPLWQPLAATFTSAGSDVIADLGRIGGPETPYELLAAADVVVMVLQRSLVQVDAAQPRLSALHDALKGRVPVGLCLIDSGAYSVAAVQKALSGLPVLAQLPHARADARVLSDGARPHLAFRTSMLMRAAGNLGHEMRKVVEERAFHPDTVAVQSMRSGGGR
jgi:hypothetical protein